MWTFIVSPLMKAVFKVMTDQLSHSPRMVDIAIVLVWLIGDPWWNYRSDEPPTNTVYSRKCKRLTKQDIAKKIEYRSNPSFMGETRSQDPV